MADRNELFNQVVQFGIDNKKNRKDMARALIKTGQFNISDISSSLDGLDKMGMFEPDEQAVRNVTPQKFAANLSTFDQTDLTEGQRKAFGFGRRMNASGEIIKSLENKIGEKGFLESVGQRIDEGQVGTTLFNRFVPEDFQKFDQARRDFINATLRRESGAVISDEEFANAEKQYFPKPGDSKAIIEQKRKSREVQTSNFLGEAGVMTPQLTEEGEEMPDASSKERFDNLMTFSLANPNDERSKKFLKMVDDGRINVETGQLTNRLGMESSAINELSEQRVDEEERSIGREEIVPEEEPRKEGFLARAGRAVGGFLGGEKIGEAIGEVAGGALAEHGEAGEAFAKNISSIEQKFQEGKLTQEQRDKLLQSQDEFARETFGYEGPSALQIAGDVAKIGITFAGGAAVKGVAGATKAAKVVSGAKTGAKFGAAAGAAEAAAEGEDIGRGAVTGAVGGAALGAAPVVGGIAAKAIRNRGINKKLDVIEEAIAPRLTAKEIRLASEQGRIERGKKRLLFGEKPDTITQTEGIQKASETIQRRIKGSSKMNDQDLSRNISSEIENVATELKPAMEEIRITPEKTKEALDVFEKLSKKQAESPDFTAFGGKIMQRNFKSFLDQAKKSVKGPDGKFRQKNLDDLWEIRKNYDKSIPDRVKKANQQSDGRLQFQKETWLDNRAILNDAINDTADGLGGTSKNAFSDMADLYTARENISSKTKIGKGKEGVINRKNILRLGGLWLGGNIIQRATGVDVPVI